MRRHVSRRTGLLVTLALLLGAVVGAGSASAENFPGGHGPILVLPDPYVSLNRGMGNAGTVFIGSSQFPSVFNIANIAQSRRGEVGFDLPITILQKDDWDDDTVEVTAKGTWIEPRLMVIYPVTSKGKSMKGRGVILGELDYLNNKSELEGKGKGNNADSNFTYTQQAAVLRAGGAYGIMDQWSIGAGIRVLAYHAPEGEFEINKHTVKTSGDPGAGLMSFELATLVNPIDELNIGVSYEVGASDNPKIKFKGENANGQDVDVKQKVYRVFPQQFDLGLAYLIKKVKLQLVGDYKQRSNTERDDVDLVLRSQTFGLGANYKLDGTWMIRGGLNKLDESGDGKLNTTGLTIGASADASKEFDVDMNLGYFTGKEEVGDEDAKYQDIRVGAQGTYRFK